MSNYQTHREEGRKEYKEWPEKQEKANTDT